MKNLFTVFFLCFWPWYCWRPCAPAGSRGPLSHRMRHPPPTVPSEEPTAPVTEKPEPATEPSGETEPYVIDDENFEIFSELDSTYWYIGSDPTITLKDFGLKITLPDGWVDRVEIIRNASQDDLELYIGNSALMLAYDMESADPDIKGSDGYFDWVFV